MRFKILTFIFALLLIQLVNCIPEDQLFKIESINLLPINENFTLTETFNSQTGIHFEIQTTESRISSMKNGLIGTCYAQIDPGTFVPNPLDTTSFILTLDKEIIFNKDTIQPGINLLSHNNLKSFVYYWQPGYNGTTLFGFSNEPDFLNMLKIINGSYQIYFRCQTTDGRIFSDELLINMNF